jgi:eukaryotic-like serine/threonine-protein kinase
MPSSPLEPGDPRRLGRYVLTERLGAGGQGVVYLGHAPDGTDVAVKVLRSSADARTLERLARELDAVHQVQPFVTAQVVEAGTDGGHRYVVSEFIDGPSLQDRVAAKGPLRDGELHRLAVGTATALTAIHGSGVVHRDFKPANVLLGPDGPRVVDFGIARLIDAETITSHLIGTPSYLAPEQLRGEQATPAVDLFAWGVTMAFAATGTPPFGRDSIQAVMHRILYVEPDLSGVPGSLREVIASCLSKDPRDRPTARDLLVRLVDPSAATGPAPTGPHAASSTESYDAAPTGPYVGAFSGSYGGASSEPFGAASMPTGPYVTPDTGPVRPPSGRSRTVALACGALAAVLLIGLGAFELLGRGAHRSPSRTPSSSAPAKDGTTIPASFAGTWAGTIEERVITTKNTALRVVLRAGQRTGEADYEGQACRGVLTLTAARPDGLEFQLAFPQGGCVAGTVTLTRQGDRLDYQWHDQLGLASAHGPLHRTA